MNMYRGADNRAVERRLSSLNESSHLLDNKFHGKPFLREWKKVFLVRHYFGFHLLLTAMKNEITGILFSNCRHFQLQNEELRWNSSREEWEMLLGMLMKGNELKTIT